MSNNFPDIKRVCIYGVGGVGGYFGGKIANKLNSDNEMGYELYFIARNEHLNIIKHNGITVITPDQIIIGRPSLAINNVNDIPNPDLFLICVKSYDLREVINSIIAKVNKTTVVMPLLNGVDIYDRTRAILDNGIVLPACVFLGTHIERPGVIKQTGGDGVILFGMDPKFPKFTPENVMNFFKKMSIDYKWNDDPFPALWKKYIFIASFGLVTVYSDKTLGEIMEDEESKRLVQEIMTEICSIAEKKGIRLSENIIDESVEKANKFPYETKTSYQRDVESKGTINEGDLYGGTIIRMGEALGILTPFTKLIYSEIRQRLDK
jgi:2-dehydropantoate 2-reductase